MGIKKIIPVTPFILTASGIFLRQSDILIPIAILIGITAIAFQLRENKIPFWIFLVAAQIVSHIAGDQLHPFYYPLVLINPLPIYNIYLLGSEIIFRFARGIDLVSVIPLALFIVIHYIFKNQIKEKIDMLSRELSLIRKRAELITPDEADTEKLLAAFKITSPHPGIYRPILYFLSYLRKSLEAQTVAFFYKHGDELVLILGVSTVPGFKEGIRIKSGEGIVGFAVKECKDIIVPDFSLKVGQLGYYKKRVKVKSVAAIPVVFGERTEGILVIDSNTRSYNENNRDELKSASFTLAYLTGMVRLYEQRRRDAVHYSALYEMAKRLQKELNLDNILQIATDVASTIFETDHVGIAKVDTTINQGEVLLSTGLKEVKLKSVFSLDDGLVGWIAKYRNYLINNQLKKGNLYRIHKKEGSHPYNSFIGVPITAENIVFGVLWIESRAKGFFREEDSELLNFLAFQLSLAWNRAILHEKVSELAIRDSLTNLYNHGRFHEELDLQLQKNKKFVLLFIDIDHFKKINDSYGHQVGDQVLITVSKILLECEGIPGRYGGEEFALILPDFHEKKGVEFAIKLREKIKKQEMRVMGNTIKITVSIGLAFYPKEGKNKEDLIRKADSALYRAKEDGRDRVSI